MQGVYNPFTMSGTIVVDGVVASVRSEWFLDAITPDPLARYLPCLYQALLWPARVLYHLMGPTEAARFDEEVLTPTLTKEPHHGLTVRGFLYFMGLAAKHLAVATLTQVGLRE